MSTKPCKFNTCGICANCELVKPVNTLAPIKIYNASVGKHYMLVQKDNKPVRRYLGKYTECGSRARDEYGQYPPAPVYVFEKETIGDHYPAEMVAEVIESMTSEEFPRPESPYQSVGAAGGGASGGAGAGGGASGNRIDVSMYDDMPALETIPVPAPVPIVSNVGPATVGMFLAGGAAAGPAILHTIVANGGGQNLSPAQETAKEILSSRSSSAMDTLFASMLMTQSICGCRFPQRCGYCG